VGAVADNPLHKAPLGLLGAFALKVLGRNPDKFGEAVLPVVDVYDQYLDTTEARVVGTMAIGTRTISGAHVLPSRYAYRVLAIGVSFSLDAADVALTATTITSMTSPAVAGTVTEPQGTMVVNGATGLFRSLGLWLPRPFFLMPGWQIIQRVYLSANVTAATNVNFCMVVQPLEL
jgi:hypothetical protein